MTTNAATKFSEQFYDTNSLMTALDEANIQSDQDFRNETTTWTFEDGSTIVVSGNDWTIDDSPNNAI